ncbi:U4/U5/U6 small nuclear ribonucleoprotein prp3 [Hypsizygus marmoreus]|uniref:U4/U5/U6 small nuclear ribonucleoprotein prp3 n=1 Tax=Hypsizygus marmoreus TaxID=39966 RepID=A0A369K4C2_HYPMA|nr:U4/U5/U6 small nuclear ribonucleoprotein prp3 [Hypsizygus marmoreus]
MSDKKRAFDGIGESPSSKKLKSDTATNGSTSSAVPSADIILQKRAEIAAKLAIMKNNTLGWTPPSIKAPIPTKPVLIPTVSSSPTVSSGPTPATGTPAPGSPSVMDDIARRVSEAKRRVAEAQSKLAVKDNPYMSMPQTGRRNRPVEQTQQGAGLKMAAHPLLLDTTPALPQSKKDRYKPMQPKFASIKANVRNAPTPPPPPPPAPTPESSNPYAAAAAKDTGFEGAPRERVGRSIRFNPKGKYVALANQMRQENQLEALKQRIAESARKAGFDGEMGVEKNIKRVPPPAAEWWDASLLPNKTYDDLAKGISKLNIHTHDSPITIYIQHPIPIPAPGEKNKIALKPMMLTKREQKKMRKLRRASELQDKRDRIRMGLLPPDPPKVGLKNLMKVLTSDAVQDPTRVEARVRREVAVRRHGHEKMNAERKLTDEQRREKLEAKKADQEKKGIYGAVFKIKVLSDPAHQFKIRKNAEQLALSGVTIFNPQFNMVYVEGSAKSIKQYKRLLLHRIAWTEAARPRGAEDVVLENGDSDAEEESIAATKVETTPLPGEGDTRASLEDNKCFLVWEGQLRDRAFSGFKGKSCPTDRDAKEVLGEKMKGYWDQAKNWKPEEEELY